MLFHVDFLSLACDPSTLKLFLLRMFKISSSMPTPGDAAEENSWVFEARWIADGQRGFFSMFKTYLESRLDENTKQLESKSKLDKQVTQMKFKGN